jgi:carbamoylphosphate synthase large subunit
VGFHPRKSTVNEIFVSQEILEWKKEFRISIHLLFIDFKSVYVSIDRERTYEDMNELNIPDTLIRLVK